MEMAIRKLSEEQYDKEIIQILFNDSQPSKCENVSFTPLDHSLNSSQIDAVSFALGSKDIALIHGPPGTGKTTTIVEYIRQAILRNEKILVCAPSNVAVDNIAEKLIKSKVKMCRIGHPARVLDIIQQSTLDVVVSNSNGETLKMDNA